MAVKNKRAEKSHLHNFFLPSTVFVTISAISSHYTEQLACAVWALTRSGPLNRNTERRNVGGNRTSEVQMQSSQLSLTGWHYDNSTATFIKCWVGRLTFPTDSTADQASVAPVPESSMMAGVSLCACLFEWNLLCSLILWTCRAQQKCFNLRSHGQGLIMCSATHHPSSFHLNTCDSDYTTIFKQKEKNKRYFCIGWL